MGCIAAGMAEVPVHWDGGKLGGHGDGGQAAFQPLRRRSSK